MNNFLFRIIFFNFVFFIPYAQSNDSVQILQLLGRENNTKLTTTFTSEQQAWLNMKKNLVIGVSIPNHEPFDFTLSRVNYEGISADYVALISQLTKLNIVVKTYSNKADVITALKNEEIDLIPGANLYEKSQGPFELTHPYLIDKVALFSRNKNIGWHHQFQPKNESISVVDNYLNKELLEKIYPNAHWRFYSSTNEAINALYFGKVDYFLGDFISANYFINQRVVNDVQLYTFLDVDTNGFAFAYRKSDLLLGEIINLILINTSEQTNENILKRWGSDAINYLKTPNIEFSIDEKEWIKNNPIITFSTLDKAAPYSFYDKNDSIQGITKDILNIISFKTGLIFNIKLANSLDQYEDMVNLLSIKLNFPSSSKNKELTFTTPIFYDNLVLVTKIDKNIENISDLKPNRLVLQSNSTTISKLKHDNPDFKFITSDNILDSMQMIRDNKADATIVPLRTGQYYVIRYFNDSLKISSMVYPSVPFSFTTNNNTTLNSIIQKAIISISPSEISYVKNKWRENSHRYPSSWKDYKNTIYLLVIFTIVIAIISFFWNKQLYKQIKVRKKIESDLHEQIIFMQALINGIPHPIYVLDKNLKIIKCNNNYNQYFNVSKETILGRTPSEINKDSQNIPSYENDYKKVIENMMPICMDRSLHLHGVLTYIYHWIEPYFDYNGKCQGVICGWIDITEKQNLIAQLEQASRAKTTFLATMSHEIRTPMNAIIGLLELAIKNKNFGKPDYSGLKVAYKSAHELQALIGDILDVVRIESGHIELSPQRVNFRETLTGVIRIFDGLARQKHLQLSMSIDADIINDIYIDPMRFRQILTNLLSNAIKFTNKGKVSLTAKRLEPSEFIPDTQKISIIVEDTGMGIGIKEQQKLFQPFFQAHDDITKQGAGLGLSIIDSLCELMGAQINLTSTLHQGTIVEIQLLVETLKPEQKKEQENLTELKSRIRHHKILIVEDHAANRLLLCQQLQYLGYQVSTAKNGDEGLQLWCNHEFNIMITDCNMPIMDGYQLTKRVREIEKTKSYLTGTYIIGLTANAQAEQYKHCIDVGMNDCLFKPLSLNTLNQALSKERILMPCNPIENKDNLSQLDLTPIIHAFIKENKNDKKTLYTALNENNFKLLTDTIHKIKGASRILSEHDLANYCESLEHMLDQKINKYRIFKLTKLIISKMEDLEKNHTH